MNKTFFIIFFISIFSSILTLSNSIKYEGGIVATLPVFYLGMLLVFYNVFNFYKKSFIFKIFQLQAMARYLLLPALYSSGQLLGIGNESNYLRVAIGIMCIELLIIYTVFLFYARKQQAVT